MEEEQFNKLFAILEEIRDALKKGNNNRQHGNASSSESQDFACEITDDLPVASKTGDWIRYRAKAEIPGYQSPRYVSLWIRADKSANISEGDKVKVNGRLDKTSKDGKTYYSIFVNKILDEDSSARAPAASSATEEEDDVPF